MALSAISATLDLTQLAAACAPIPYLGLGVAAAQAIVMLAQAVPANKEECVILSRRCQEVLVLIVQNTDKLDQTRMELAVRKAIDTIVEIQTAMVGWSKLGRTESFFKQKTISAEISKKQLALHDCCTHLNLVAQLQLHKWASELDQAREMDQKLIYDIAQTQAQMLEIMRGLQISMHEQKLDTTTFEKTEAQLLGFQARSGQPHLPICKLRGECKKIGSPVGGTSAYDIYEGLWLGKQKVALKALRGAEPTEKKLRRFHRQVEIWSKLNNPFILTLYGARYDDGPSPYLVSPWLHNGDAMKYLTKNPDADRLGLALEVAYGLQYLHSLSPPIVHGGLQGSSVLISDAGRAVIADFGLSKALEELADTMYTASNGAGAAFRWMAPELQSDGAVMERSADVYAWGMTALQLLTGLMPFHKIKSPGRVIIDVAMGKRPNIADYDTCPILQEQPRLWELFQRCWMMAPEERPGIEEIVMEMDEIVSAAQ